MTETQQRTASGTGIGAATRAAVGGTGGYIHDQQTQRAQAQTEVSRLRQENEQLRLQQDAERLRLENQRLQMELQEQKQN